MFHVVLVAPEIPPNTGNAIRLCANTGAQCAFGRGRSASNWTTRACAGRGLDYHEWRPVRVHSTLPGALAAIGAAGARVRLDHARTDHSIAGAAFHAGDVFVFGRERRPCRKHNWPLFAPAQPPRLHMRPGAAQPDLSNAVAVVVFEAWRQAGCAGGM